MTHGDPPIPPPPPPAPDPIGSPTGFPPPGPPVPGSAPATTPVPYATPGHFEIDPQARQWGMFAHLAGLGGFVVPGIGHLLGPFIVWMMKKDHVPFVNDQAKESLNFQITVTIVFVAALIITVASACIGLPVGIFLLPLIGIGDAVMAVIAALEANKGIYYRYPLALRLIK